MIYKNIYCNLVKITCIQRNVYSTSTISSKVKVDVLLKKKQKQEKRLLRLANQKLNQERKNVSIITYILLHILNIDIQIMINNIYI